MGGRGTAESHCEVNCSFVLISLLLLHKFVVLVG